MSYDLQHFQLAPDVQLWKPTTDLLHDPAVEPQAIPCDDVFLGLPLGECGGVLMANQAIERIGQLAGGAVYGNHVPTHGADANAQFAEMGAQFGLALGVIPPNSPYVISAHGAAPSVGEAARAHGLDVYNVTCPLVERTHTAIRRAAGSHVAYISLGKRDHPELVGAAGLAEEAEIPFSVVSNEQDIDDLIAGAGEGTTVTVVGQTTNNSDEAGVLARYLRDRATERGIGVARENLHDVCHTVRDRQRSTREIVAAHNVGTLIVVGSVDSKNTKSLADVAAKEAVAQSRRLTIYLANSWGQLPPIAGRVGVVSGASTLSRNVHGVIDRLAPTNGVTEVGEDTDGNIVFKPVDMATRRLLAATEAE